MIIDDLKNLGREFRTIFKDIVNTSDLERAIDDVRRTIASIQPVKKQPVQVPVYFQHAPIGKASSILLIVFGSIGLGVFGASTLALMLVGAAMNLVAGLSVFSWISAILLNRGIALRKRLKRYRIYLGLLKGRNSCMIRELSLYTRLGEKFILRDFRIMIAKGFFPQAHIDDEKTMIMLNHETYEQYLIQQSEFHARKTEEKRQAAENRKRNTSPEYQSNNQRAETPVEEGKKAIRQIAEARTAITDPEVSEKIRRLEDTISRIIGHIEIHPEKLPDVRRFMSYYLPTTLKLLDAYKEFDRHPIPGDNIKTAKAEIRDALDTINAAFENLFDDLFEQAAWDVSADISAMKTIFARDGLTEDDFKK